MDETIPFPEIMDPAHDDYKATVDCTEVAYIGNKDWIITHKSQKKLNSGTYKIDYNPKYEYIFSNIEYEIKELIRFDASVIDAVVHDAFKFWNRKDIYDALKLPHKRSYLLYGDQGCGKSSLINMLVKDLLDRCPEALCILYSNHLIEGLRQYNNVDPDAVKIIIIEDIDTLMEDKWMERELLQFLDGSGPTLKNSLVIATTNHLDSLEDRVKNRPSRFDKVIKIPTPNRENREIFIREKIALLRNSKIEVEEEDILQIIEKTAGLSVSHIVEIIVSTYGLGDNLADSIKRANDMKNKSNNDKGFGFSS